MCHGFTVFGKAVLFEDVIEPGRHGLVEEVQNRGTPNSDFPISPSAKPFTEFYLRKIIMNPHVLESLRKTFDHPDAMSRAHAERVVVDDENLESSTPANDHAIEQVRSGPLALLELILKDPIQLDRLIRRPEYQPELVSRLLAISLIGFIFFGVAMSLVLSAATVWPHLFPIDAVLEGKQVTPLRFETGETSSLIAPWLNGNAFRLIAAYAIGLIAATGICLPSLYFYGLLSGVRMTMMDVVIHSLKSKAVAAVTLVGILPIYAAFGLAIAIFPLPESLRDSVLLLGLVLPFVAGLSGTYSLYRGLSTLTDTMDADRRFDRECFLQRLVLSWSGVYSAVSPVLIFTLWQRLQG